MSDRDSGYLVATGASKPSNVEADTRTRGVAMSTARATRIAGRAFVTGLPESCRSSQAGWGPTAVFRALELASLKRSFNLARRFLSQNI